MKTKFVLTAYAGIFVLAACGNVANTSQPGVTGSGTVITTDRTVSGFSQIQVNIGADLTLIQGESESLSIATDDNLMSYIETTVVGDKLVITTPDNTNLVPSRDIQITVTFVNLNSVEVLGKSNVTAYDLSLAQLTLYFAGTGTARLTGSVDEQTITVLGRATIHNFGLTSRQVRVDISGNGMVEVRAEDTLSITVSGSGDIRYMGKPSVSRQVTGTATIQPAS